MQVSVVVRWGFLAAATCFVLTGFSADGSDPKRIPVSILSPKPNDVVGKNCEVVGKLVIAGQPVVLVCSEESQGEWYVQPAVEINQQGVFKSRVQIGNEKTPAGARFQVAVVVIRTAEEAEFFKGKESLISLPETLARSAPISIAFGKKAAEPAASRTGPAELLSQPVAGDRVKTVTEVKGKVAGSSFPVVLVRSGQLNDSWWVQEPVVVSSKGEFSCPARFGNEKTPSGEKFHVVVLMFPTAKAAEAYKTGATLKQLPQNVPCSDEIVVVLERSEATASVTTDR